MRKLILIFAIFLFTAELCWAAGYVVTGKTESYAVRIIFDKSRPVIGSNRMEIAVTDAASRPVTNARVGIEYFMPSLPGRPPMMDYHAAAKSSGDKYEAVLGLAMKGEWKVAVSIMRPNETERMTFGFEVK